MAIALPPTSDSQVLALLCTTVGLPRGGVKPLNGSEWSSLATAIHNSELERPGALLGRSAGELTAELGIGRPAAERIETLLRRGGQLAFELERLSSRGIWLVTRADDVYPRPLKDRLKRAAPAVLFGAGAIENLGQRAAAIVGSRDADPDSLSFAGALGHRLAADGVAVVSGAARGVDSAAMLAAIDAGGAALGFVADSLEKSIRRQDLRQHLTEGLLTLLSSYHPEARFSVGNAMRRNRLIYAMSEAAFVVASAAKGGTWEGAQENLKHEWAPLFVRAGSDAPDGNRALVRSGARPFAIGDLDEPNLLERLSMRSPGEQLAVAIGEETPGEVSAAGDRQDDEVSAVVDRQHELPAPELLSVDTARPNDPPDKATASEAFVAVWPLLAKYLTVARSEREVADQLGLELSQARAWLRRGVDEGRLTTSERPRRYSLASGETRALFDDQ